MAITLTTEQFQALLATISQGQTPTLPTQTTQPIVFHEFCESMKYLNVTKLQNMSIVDFIVATIKYNIDSLEEAEYPFVCSNEKKRFYYFYTEDGWKKGTSFVNLLYTLIIKQAYRDLEKHYSIKYTEDDEEDEEAIEKKYASSKHAEKQAIIMNLCHSNKMNWECVCEKVLTKIAKLIKVDASPV
jgi:hypothetical protein